MKYFRQVFEDKRLQAYINGGAGDETALQENEAILQSLRLIPRVMMDVEKANSHVNDILGAHDSPLVIGPTAFHRLVSTDGECSTALCSKLNNIPYVVSSFASCDVREIREILPASCYWQQLYIFNDPAITEEIVSDAEKFAAQAIIVTVGTPVSGDRPRERQAGWSVPAGVCARFNLKDPTTISQLARVSISQSATWDDIKNITMMTSIPILLKGILDPDDALRAVQIGCSGIIVSNHGGRQFDHSISALDTIGDIKEIVQGEIPIYLDGGIRTGLDVVKSIACGADRVLLGRAILWKLHEGGTSALNEYLHHINEEILHIMKLCGCPTISAISGLKVVRRV